MSAPDTVNILLDKHGRQIMPGDTLKVFHFIGPRRKRYFMYKWVEAVVTLGNAAYSAPFLKISHLSLKPEHYHERLDGRRLDHVEIVQGYEPDGQPFDTRPKHSLNEAGS